MIRASVVAADAVYEMFDVASLDARGARLVGPLLLEIGEEVTLRLVRGTSQVEVRARVTRVEREAPGAQVAATLITFLADVGDRLAPMLQPPA